MLVLNLVSILKMEMQIGCLMQMDCRMSGSVKLKFITQAILVKVNSGLPPMDAACGKRRLSIPLRQWYT